MYVYWNDRNTRPDINKNTAQQSHIWPIAWRTLFIYFYFAGYTMFILWNVNQSILYHLWIIWPYGDLYVHVLLSTHWFLLRFQLINFSKEDWNMLTIFIKIRKKGATLCKPGKLSKLTKCIVNNLFSMFIM